MLMRVERLKMTREYKPRTVSCTFQVTILVKFLKVSKNTALVDG